MDETDEDEPSPIWRRSPCVDRSVASLDRKWPSGELATFAGCREEGKKAQVKKCRWMKSGDDDDRRRSQVAKWRVVVSSWRDRWYKSKFRFVGHKCVFGVRARCSRTRAQSQSV